VNDLIPAPWEFVLASLAVFRLWRLLAEDEILEVPRRKLLRYEGWNEGDQLPDGYRVKWRDFLVCPWCAGFHLSIGAYLLWLWIPTVALMLATPFALSAAVGLIRTNLDPPEE
jgi:hypothetical protein